MPSRYLLLPIALAFCVAGHGFSQETAAKGDPRFLHQLDRMGLKYSITRMGNLSLNYSLDGGRSQVVYISGSTEKLEDMEVMEVWSRAGTFNEAPTSEVMKDLLLESGEKPIGSWNLERASDGGYTVYFSTRVPVYIGDADLASILQSAAATADQKEADLFNADDE